MLDLWTLRVLVAVADGGSLSAAASALSLTQPAVSRQIGSLERRVGTPLFTRHPRGVRPTHAGEVAIGQARAIVARVADLEAQMAAISGLLAGRVRLSGFASVNTAFLPSVIARFAALHPGIEVNLVDVPTPETVAAVREGRIDVGMVTELDLPPAGGDEGVELLPLVEDELLVALARDHPLAGDRTVPLSALAAETWIDGTHPDCLGQLDDLRRPIGAPPRIGHVCDDWNGKMALVAAGLGITLVPGLAAQHVRDDVVLCRPEPSLRPRTTYLVTRERQHRSAAIAAIVDVTTAVIKERH